MGYIQTNSDQSLKTKLITQRVIPLAKLTQILSDYNRDSEMPLAAYLIKNNYLTKEKILEVMPKINPDDLIVPMTSFKNEFPSDYAATMTNDLPNFLSNNIEVFNSDVAQNDLFAQNQNNFGALNNEPTDNNLFTQNQEPIFDSTATNNDLFAQNQEPIFDSTATNNNLFTQNQEPIFDSTATDNNLFTQNQEPIFDSTATDNNLFTQNQDNFNLFANTATQNNLENQEQDQVTFFKSGLTQNDIFTQNQNSFNLLDSMSEQNNTLTQNDTLTQNNTLTQNDTPKDNFVTTQQQTGFMDLISETHIEPPKSTDLELDFADAAPKKVESKTNEKKSESKTIPFGKACILLHFTTQENVDEALQIQRTKSPQKKLGEIMVEQGMIAPDKVKTVLDRQQVRSMICKKCNKSYKIVLYQASKKYKCKVCSSNLVLEDENSDTIKVDRPKAPTQFIGLTQEIPMQVRPPQQQEPELDFAEDYVAPNATQNSNNNAGLNFDSNDSNNDIHNINVFQPVERTETILEKVGIDVNQLRDHSERSNSYQQALTQRRMKTIAVVAGIVLVIAFIFVFSPSTPKRVKQNRSTNTQKQRSESDYNMPKVNRSSYADLDKEWSALQTELEHITEESNQLDQDKTIDSDVDSAKLLQKWSPLLENCRKAKDILHQFEVHHKGERNQLEIDQVNSKMKKATDICQNHMKDSINATLDNALNLMPSKIPEFSNQIQKINDIVNDFYSNIVMSYQDVLPDFKSEMEEIQNKNIRIIKSTAAKEFEKLQTKIGSELENLSNLSNSKKFEKLDELKEICHREKTRQLKEHVVNIDKELEKIEALLKKYKWYRTLNEDASTLYKYIKDYKFKEASKHIKSVLSKRPDANEEICDKLDNEIQEYKTICDEMWKIFRTLSDKETKVEWKYNSDNSKKISKQNTIIQSVAPSRKSITIGKRTSIRTISLDQITFETLTHVYNSYAIEGSDKEFVYCFFYIGKKVEDLKSLYALKIFSEFHDKCLLFYTIQEILLCATDKASNENNQKIIDLIESLDIQWGNDPYYKFSAEELAKSVHNYIQKAKGTKNLNELGESFNTYLSHFMYNSNR